MSRKINLNGTVEEVSRAAISRKEKSALKEMFLDIDNQKFIDDVGVPKCRNLTVTVYRNGSSYEIKTTRTKFINACRDNRKYTNKDYDKNPLNLRAIVGIAKKCFHNDDVCYGRNVITLGVLANNR